MRELLECLLGISPSGRNPCEGNNYPSHRNILLRRYFLFVLIFDPLKLKSCVRLSCDIKKIMTNNKYYSPLTQVHFINSYSSPGIYLPVSLPADVLWGSFVTEKWMRDKRTPKDVCGEAISRLAQLVYCPSAKRKPCTGLNQPERQLRPLIDNLSPFLISGKRNRTHVSSNAGHFRDEPIKEQYSCHVTYSGSKCYCVENPLGITWRGSMTS